MNISRFLILFVITAFFSCVFNSCSSDDSLPEVHQAPMIGNVSIGEFNLDAGTVSISVAPEDREGNLILDGLNSSHFDLEDLQIFSMDADTLVTSAVASLNIEIQRPDQETPVSLVLSFDTSGSMTSNDPDRLSIEAGKLLIDRLREEDQAAVIEFGGRSASVVKEFTNDKELLKEVIDDLSFGGATPMFDSIHKSIDLIEEAMGESAAIVVLADGDNNRNPRDRDEVVVRANQNNIPIFTIALGDDLDFEDLIYFSDFTGGIFAEASEAGALEELFEGIANTIFEGRVIINADLFFDRDLPEAGQYLIEGTLVTDIGGNRIEIPVSFPVTANEG
jgi:hypothetical protein